MNLYQLEIQTILSLRPNAQFSIADSYSSLIWHDANQTKPTQAEFDAKYNELVNAEPMRILRLQRDQLLQQSDWMGNSDVTMTEQWRVYRQALRDITTQTPSLDENGNLTGITWPTPPTD